MSENKDAYKLNPKNWPEMKARCSYPNLFKATAMPGSDRKSFGIELLFDKSEVKASQLLKPLHAAARDKWGANKENWPKIRWAIRDGDVPKYNKKSKKKEVRPEHEGMWVVKASSNEDFPPAVYDLDKKAITNPRRIYPGCYVRAALMAHAYTFGEDTTGVKFILDAVQFVEDGEALGSQKNSEDLFGALAGADDVDSEADFTTSGEADGIETENESFI